MDAFVFWLLSLMIVAGGAWYLFSQKRKEYEIRIAAIEMELDQQKEQVSAYTARNKELEKLRTVLLAKVELLSKWQGVEDADAEAIRILERAKAESQRIKSRALEEEQSVKDQTVEYIAKVKAQIKKQQDEASQIMASAHQQAQAVIADAHRQAENIAGHAYAAQKNADNLAAIIKAMKNTIEGYGDEYLVPSHDILDDLAEELSHTDAGVALKNARNLSRYLVKDNKAATCDYVEPVRQSAAIHFVTDAFNGKVEAVLSRVKHDNAGRLTQEIRDAYTLVNSNGEAFRNARILPGYLEARISELKWAAAAHLLKLEEREEQRQIKEQIREEERAKREYEKAMKEAAKEESTLKKALEKARTEMAEASEAQKEKYEAQLAELEEKLKAAEEKNQRALSMAQQTRSGHVYVISNIGSFGENIYKIGLTRRLEPMDRVKELGDASVPFEFDVHAMIYSEDAPTLENQLHQHFSMAQLNKVNPRKEFFRTSLKEIRQEVESMGLKAAWTMMAKAEEYRTSRAIEKAMEEGPVREVLGATA